MISHSIPLPIQVFSVPRDEEKVFRELFEIVDYDKQGLANPEEIIAVLKAFRIFVS